MFGLRVLEKLIVLPAGGYVPEDVGGKVMIRGQEPTSATTGIIALTEVAAAADLSGVSFPFVAVGY